MLSLVLIFLLCATLNLCRASGDFTRGALIVTLAGNHKLSPYFEWSCKTIGYSQEMFDMLVFHESNVMVKNLTCASNVKFIDLGERSLSKLIVDEILRSSNISESTRTELYTVVSDIIVHSPRYLVEVKPMTGSLFSKHLQSYSHWSYTDPDIIWGNLADWVEKSDLNKYDIVTLSKNVDAGRLFIRGQFAMHKNKPALNLLWKGLEYFSYLSFAKRVGNAYRMLLEKQSTDEIFNKNFNSAEGWYSQLIFKNKLISVKIVSRGFDDFFREPVIINKGRLTRCALETPLTECIHNATTVSPSDILNLGKVVTARNLPEINLIDATAHYDVQHCKMAWLPAETRYCLATSVYDKDAALVQDKQSALKLLRVGEAVYEDGKWQINDESVSKRQYRETAALFHFRHWDDFIKKSFSTEWGKNNEDGDPVGCMVLYLRYDSALSFEACASVVEKEKFNKGKSILLESIPARGSKAGKKHSQVEKDVSLVLAEHRRHDEVGAPTGGGGGAGGGGKHSHHRGNLRGGKPGPKHKPRPEGGSAAAAEEGEEEGEEEGRGHRQRHHKPAPRNRRGEEEQGESGGDPEGDGDKPRRKHKHKPKPRPEQ